MTTMLDEAVVASGAEMRDLAFRNLEAVIAGWERVAGMLDEKHPLAQTVIGLNAMAERSLRAVILVPMSAVVASEPGTAIIKVEQTDEEKPEPDARKPWAVAHSKRKHYCIGRDRGCPYSVHGNSIGRHQKNCEIVKAMRLEEAKAIVADSKKLGVAGRGKVVKMPERKKAPEKKAPVTKKKTKTRSSKRAVG